MEGFCQLYLPKLNGRKVLGREKENMYRKDSEGWLKHGDFIVLDMICLQLAFILAYAFRGYGFNVYGDILYRNMAIFLGFADLVVIFTSGTMKSVLKRGHYKEFVSTLKNAVAVGAVHNPGRPELFQNDPDHHNCDLPDPHLCHKRNLEKFLT